MALLTVQRTNGNTGAALTANTVSASDTFANDGATILIVRNRNASSCTVGIAPATASAYVPNRGTFTAPTISQAVGAGTDAVFGPFDPNQYNNASGLVTVTFSVTSTVTATPLAMDRL